MANLTSILARVESGDPAAANELLPLVYQELRQLAAAKLAHELPGQTLQPTGLVHEAYLRLSKDAVPQAWANRRHFFGAAAEAMRRILIENARKRKAAKHGGLLQRVEMTDVSVESHEMATLDTLALDEALARLQAESPQRAELVKLRFFAGLTMAEIANVQGISLATAERHWVYARTWLFAALQDRETLSE